MLTTGVGYHALITNGGHSGDSFQGFFRIFRCDEISLCLDLNVVRNCGFHVTDFIPLSKEWFVAKYFAITKFYLNLLYFYLFMASDGKTFR